MFKFSLQKILKSLSCLCLVSCASQDFRYVAADHAAPLSALSSTEKRSGEASYSLPPDKPQMNVRVRSMGIVSLKPKSSNERIPAVHVRLSLSNTSASSWILKPAEELAIFPNRGQVHPLFVNSNVSTSEDIQVNPDELRVVDFYFTLPAHIAQASELAEFEFKWSLQSGNLRLGETTRFERISSRDSAYVIYPYEPYPVGYGPSWYGWGGPGFYPPPPPPPVRVRQ